MEYLTKTEIADVIFKNDVSKAIRIMERVGLSRGVPDGLSFADFSNAIMIASIMLSCVSTKEYRIFRLDNDLANELMDRTGMLVQIFSLLKLVVVAANLTPHDLKCKDVKNAIINNEYSDEIAYKIEKEISRRDFESLLVAILNSKRLDVRFNIPIIHRIYYDELIPCSLLFAYMAICLRDLATACMKEMTGDIVVTLREIDDRENE